MTSRRGERNLTTHRLPWSSFQELYNGPISEALMTTLEATQYSRRLLSLLVLLDAAAESDVGILPTGLEDIWTILIDAQERRPEIFAKMLLHPPVGVWLTRSLRKKNQLSRSELGYLCSITAAAAIRAGLPRRIHVPISQGLLIIPTVGAVSLRNAVENVAVVESSIDGVTTVVFDEERVAFSADRTSAEFSPITKQEVVNRGLRLEVVIDDVDPYREFTDAVPAHRLSSKELLDWQQLLDSSWNLLTEHYKDYAAELSSGLSSLSPVSADNPTPATSSRAAFGGIALTPKKSPAELAETFIHEMQHSKLNAILDLVDLHHKTDKFWYAPWRVDPRPLTGFLHGIYSFAGVVEFWDIQRHLVTDPAQVRAAHFTFAHHRCQVGKAISILRGAPELTELGKYFIEVVDSRLTRQDPSEITPELLDIASQLVENHQLLWHLRHTRIDDAAITVITHAWLDRAKKAPALPAHACLIVPGKLPRDPELRGELLKKKALLTTKEFIEELTSSETYPASATPTADIAYVIGQHKQASDEYRARIHQASDDVQAWAGLALTTPMLQHRPEVTYAVHKKSIALKGKAPDPIELATWLNSR